MAEPPDPVIALVGFSFRHVGADRPGLADVTLEVRAGEYLGVLGAVGAGVTTLLTALDGVVPQLVRGETSGSIAVLGIDPRLVPVAEQARRVGLVFDDPSLASTQPTVAEEVAFGLENLGVPRAEMDARISASLTAVGLAGFELRDPLTLSGGELQRLAIACALVIGPSILVLDEPSANLDPAGRRSVAGIVRRLNREHGVTLVVGDQDPEGLAADATRVVVLDAGRVVAEGGPDEVLGDPAMLRRHGVRSTGAAALAERLGLETPVPITVDELARRVMVRAPDAAPPAAARVADGSSRAIDVREVVYRYPRTSRPAVADISFSVAPGEVVGVVGANGSGKTTLARLVNGILRPQAGRVSVDGMDTAAHPLRTLAAHVGSVFQDPMQQLFATTVADELALGPRALGLSEAVIGERVRAVAQVLELDELLMRHPLRLGRAERKLVALGAVLTMQPPVLVLDEPTTGADLRLAAIIERETRAAAAVGRAVLVASHDMAFLGRVASRLLVMGAGRLLADAPIHAVFADAALLAVAGLEAPPVTRVSVAAAGHEMRAERPPAGLWPPVSIDEAVGVLARARGDEP